MDEGRHTPCCQFASDDEITGDEAQFACDTCPVFEAIEALSPENTRAWSLFHTCASRFLGETHAVGPVFVRLTTDLSAEDFEDMVQRLSVIYTLYFPPKRATDGA